MEGNDITTSAPIKCGCLFEGVLANPPKGVVTKMRAATAARQHEWHRYIGLWDPSELAVKSLVDMVNRRGVGVEVYTLQPENVADAMERWLSRKGVSVPVLPYDTLSHLSDDLKYRSPSMIVYVATEDQANDVGVKASVVYPGKAWSF